MPLHCPLRVLTPLGTLHFAALHYDTSVLHALRIVILGGGVMGASVAYHLAARGARDILVIDRAGAPGGGSTSRATGGFRAQYATPINVRLSLLAREKLRRFREEIGGECGYEPFGYLWLAMSAHELAILDAGARDAARRGPARGAGRSRRGDRPTQPGPDARRHRRRRVLPHRRLHPSAGHSRRLPVRGGASRACASSGAWRRRRLVRDAAGSRQRGHDGDGHDSSRRRS